MYEVRFSSAAERYFKKLAVYEESAKLVVVLLAGSRESVYEELKCYIH